MPQARRDHIPLSQKDFRGLYSRGVDDSVPDPFFQDCLNVQFTDGEVRTRDGLELWLTKSNIVRFHMYKRLNETPRAIMLDSSGNLLDSTAPGTPIYTDASFVDFSLINYSNRAYITPHNRIKGIAGKSLLIYEGTGNARLAAGTAPSGFTLTVVNSATVGSVEAGIHIIAVCNITSSGFITAPGPEVFPTVTATGGFKLNVSGIAVGGTSVVARVVLATKAIPVSLFNGNLLGYEFFFVPDGTINDNTTTSLTINFFDSDLVDSADYLFDSLPTIPAGVAICIYNGRLVVLGEDGNEFTARVSEPLQPEVFNSVSGFLTVDPSDAGSGLKNAIEFRKNLLLTTSNRIYSSSDNSSDPNTWAVSPIDKSCGTEPFGIATILDARGTNNDRTWIADKSGLICFEGLVKRPEMTWNVEDFWERINKAKFNLVQVVDDAINHRLYVSVPLDAATAISHLLVGDYSKAFTVYGTIDERMVKWCPYTYPAVPISIAGDLDDVTKQPVIKILLTGGIYNQKAGLLSDFGTAIDSYIISSLKSALIGWVNHFAGIKLRVKGSGNLQISVQGEDDINSTTYNSIILSANPGLEPDRLINFTNEKCAIKLRVSLFGEWFNLSRLDVWAKELWLRRAG
jgi:hypothetical protein